MRFLERRECDAMIIRAGKSEEKAMSLKLSADCKEGEGHGRRREKVYAATREARVAEMDLDFTASFHKMITSSFRLVTSA